MKTLLAAVLVALPAVAADLPAVAPVKAACGPDNVKFNASPIGGQPAAQPEAGKALVYVVEELFRPADELITPTVRVGVDGSWVGANYGTSYLFFSVEPGEHHLCADWQSAPRWIGEKVSLTSIKVEADRTYYVRARVLDQGKHGLLDEGSSVVLDLEQINSDEGQLLVATSPLSGYRQKK
jgi:hypothetical protein